MHFYEVQNLPLGVQNFAELRQAQLLYVDKTALIFDLVKAPKGFFFYLAPDDLVNPCF